jgi:antitoxin FitA
MGQVLIRNLDDEVIESLRAKAKVKGRPLEQELREILTNAAPFTPEERVKVSDWLRGRLKAEDVDFKAAIRWGRDDEFHDSEAKGSPKKK